MVGMFSGIVFVSQIICCICFKGKLKKYGKLRESKPGALGNSSLAGVGCFCMSTLRRGLSEKRQLKPPFRMLCT